MLEMQSRNKTYIPRSERRRRLGGISKMTEWRMEKKHLLSPPDFFLGEGMCDEEQFEKDLEQLKLHKGHSRSAPRKPRKEQAEERVAT